MSDENIENSSNEELLKDKLGLDGVDDARGKNQTSSDENEATGRPDEHLQALMDDLQKARTEAGELKDAWNRERADFINYRKRTNMEQARIRFDSVMRFVSELLPSVDNLERVLSSKSESPEVANFLSGVKMIHDELVSVLNKNGIRVVSPLNEPFDPNYMEAISIENREDLEKDTVIEVYQNAYIFEQQDEKRVVRHARVIVGKAPPKNEESVSS